MTLSGEAYMYLLQTDYLIWVPSKSVGVKHLLKVKQVLMCLETMSTNTYLEEYNVNLHIWWHCRTVSNWESVNSLQHSPNSLLRTLN